MKEYRPRSSLTVMLSIWLTKPTLDESQVNGTDIAGEHRIEIFFRVGTAMRDSEVYGESRISRLSL